MAGNPNPSPKTRFKKGQSGNPAGSLPVNKVLKEVKLLTALEFRDMINKLMKYSQDELTAYVNDKDAPFIWRIYAKSLVKAYNTGDSERIETIMNRMIGKVPDKLQFEDKTKPDVDFLAEKLLEGLKK